MYSLEDGGRAEIEDRDGGAPHAASRLLPVEGGAGYVADCIVLDPPAA